VSYPNKLIVLQQKLIAKPSVYTSVGRRDFSMLLHKSEN